MQSNLVPKAWANQMSVKIMSVPDCTFVPTWWVCSLISSSKDVTATLIFYCFNYLVVNQTVPTRWCRRLWLWDDQLNHLRRVPDYLHGDTMPHPLQALSIDGDDSVANVEPSISMGGATWLDGSHKDAEIKTARILPSDNGETWKRKDRGKK